MSLKVIRIATRTTRISMSMMNSMFIFELGTKFQLKRKDTLEINQSAIVGNNQGNGEINE